MPTDEQSKSMLYAALKLRLSLVGSMLSTISASDTTALDWTTLLMQLICSGAVDRQTDSRFVFVCWVSVHVYTGWVCVFVSVCIFVFVCVCESVHVHERERVICAQV